jgi:hypothetical protein
MSSNTSEAPRQPRSAVIQILSVVLGLGPIYGFAIWAHLSIGRSYTVQEMMTYPLVFGGVTIVWVVLLLKLLCRERIESKARFIQAGSHPWPDPVCDLLCIHVC